MDKITRAALMVGCAALLFSAAPVARAQQIDAATQVKPACVPGEDGQPRVPLTVRGRMLFGIFIGKVKCAAFDPATIQVVEVDGQTVIRAVIPVQTELRLVEGETPAGVIDGVNATFVLAHVPSPASSVRLYRNGVRLSPGVDFTLTGAQVKFAVADPPDPALVPEVGAVLRVDYRW